MTLAPFDLVIAEYLVLTLGCAALFGIGELCVGSTAAGTALLAMSLVRGALVNQDISRRVRREPIGDANA